MTRKKVNLQPNDASRPDAIKRRADDGSEDAPMKKARHQSDDDEAVDYGEEEMVHQEVPSQAQGEPMESTTSAAPISPEEAERDRISKALESWCRNNLSLDVNEADWQERTAALAEVGLLLVLDYDKYPNAESMRTELEEIGSIIGGEQVVTRYINFILSLQNQLKKLRSQADRQRRPRQQLQGHFQGQQQYAHPGMMMPMMMHPPQGNPMFQPQQMQQHPMYMNPQGFPMQHPQPMGPPRGNMTLNTTGEMTNVQKQREKEKKRKEILAECTEHLKALLERAGKTPDPTDKAKIYELIDKVKKRIDSLKEVVPIPSSVPRAAAPVPKASVRGYYGNQYVNPKLVEQQAEAAANGENGDN